MQLSDGLAIFRSDPTYAALTVPLESQAQRILDLALELGSEPTPLALDAVRQFLLDVEEWKANCLQQRMVNAIRNSPRSIWEALDGAAKAEARRECPDFLRTCFDLIDGKQACKTEPDIPRHKSPVCR
jgi:hypothetical protein